MSRVLLLYDQTMTGHDPGPGHPESPERLRAIEAALQVDPIEGTSLVTPQPAPLAALQRVHDRAYVQAIEALRGRSARLDPDTAVCPVSVEAAGLAAGAAIDAVTAVVDGNADRAFALVRPPGHHAEAGRAMGFCLYNNIAVAAAHARAELACQRVLIVDWDVHHGNGTQHLFEADRNVLFFSMHQHPFWPGTGAAEEVGIGDGAGFTVNVPLPAGCGDDEHRAVFDRLLVPIADAWCPDLVLVSAGYDAHGDDPIGGQHMTEAGFVTLCEAVCSIADRHAAGRVVLVLEGGYDLPALASSVHATIRTLAAGPIQRPATPVPPAPPGLARFADVVIQRVSGIQRQFWPIP